MTYISDGMRSDWSRDVRTLADEPPGPVDTTPHAHFHEHGGIRHSHVHVHPEAHAHSARSDVAYTEEHGQ